MRKLQQGDVIIRTVRRIPARAERISRTARGYVLAEGEVTGHAHVIRDDVEMFHKNGTLFVKVEKAATIHHEEHRPVMLEAGVYAVGHVREYDFLAADEEEMWGKAGRTVRD